MMKTREHQNLTDDETGGAVPHCPACEARSTRVALVCAGRNATADSVQRLLAETPGYTCLQSEYRAGSVKKVNGGHPDPDVVIATLDAVHPAEWGRLFDALRRAYANRPVLALPTRLDAADIIRILELGAADFSAPPLRASELLPRLRRQVLVATREDEGVQKLKEEIGLKNIIGESAVLLQQVRRVPRFAQSDATVLISGESGTGKEAFARAIHYLSPRSCRPFVPVNCGAIPEGLLESEIFGHKRGAFTGAVAERRGLIREAEGGTLFLDEIDSLPRSAQAKLLRFLQEGEYRLVGSDQISSADVRVVAATNLDLSRNIREGHFRDDLFYRLNVLQISLPSLRERRGDIPALARYFVEHQSARIGRPPKSLSLAALHRLMDYAWPGNVRELQNVLTRAVLLSDRAAIEVCDLSLPEEPAAVEPDSFKAAKSRAVNCFERDYLEAVLSAHNGNITHAANAARKNRRAFWQLLRKHNLC